MSVLQSYTLVQRISTWTRISHVASLISIQHILCNKWKTNTIG